MTILYSQAKIFIHDENINDLNYLYQIIIRIEKDNVRLKDIVENYIYQTGIEQINPISTNDLHIYIQTINDFYYKYITFCQKAFDNHSQFINLLDRICRRLVNSNALIQTNGSTTKMAECLAYYCDRLLRKKCKEEIDIEKIFYQMKVLLCCMQDKDVFERLYCKLLANRLLKQLSISIDYEKLMISYIQESCGYAYASRMQQMCRDIETSVTISDQYRQTEQFPIRTSGVIPQSDLTYVKHNFIQYYNRLYNRRTLIWLHQHSNGELLICFKNVTYTLQVSTYQLIILLLFNNFSECSVKRIYDETQIQIDLLSQVLRVLFKSGILICTQSNEEENFNLNSIVKLSDDFTSMKRRINLNTPLKLIEQKEIEVFRKETDQGRHMRIQVTIVQIMKEHKLMDNNLLVQTAIEKLTSYFNPDVSVIKECIHGLIEKGYLEQRADRPDILYYIP
ncbi:hypothetical protein I4U23_030201 [Adineta vaga]|nr:hypothetical protein I4U23_030201 [Adineta vaga]